MTHKVAALRTRLRLALTGRLVQVLSQRQGPAEEQVNQTIGSCREVVERFARTASCADKAKRAVRRCKPRSTDYYNTGKKN